MNSIAISIIVPIYNTSKYLRNCLDSIVNQTMENIEIILVDDGSTDGSDIIIDEYAEKDERVKKIHKQNSGPSETRNIGIDNATGEYIMFIDSDDWIEPQTCQILYRKAKKKNADFVICGNYNVATSGITRRNIFNNEKYLSGNEYEQEIRVSTLGLVGTKMKNPAKLDRLTPIWARLYKTEIIKNNEIRFIDLNLLPSECLQFNFEFCCYAKNALYVEDVLYYYRRNTEMSVTKPFRDDLWKKWKWWIDYMREYLEKKHLFNGKIKEAYYSRICCSIIPLGGNAIKLRKYNYISREVKTFLDLEIYKTAFDVVDFSVCPLYWKIFFNAAKKCNVLLFVVLTWLMRKILDFRKK